MLSQLKDNEIDNVVKGMVDNGQLAQAGLYLGGLKYMVIQGEAGQVIRGKRVLSTLNSSVSCGDLVFEHWCIFSLYKCTLNVFLILLSLCSFQQQTGVTIKRTNSALVIGIYKEPTKGPECNVIVERMGDYLIEQGI